MSEKACKAAICDDKAQSTSEQVMNLPNILANEDIDLRIEVSEYIIGRNEHTIKKVMSMIGDR